jgi:hypothetical protein
MTRASLAWEWEWVPNTGRKLLRTKHLGWESFIFELSKFGMEGNIDRLNYRKLIEAIAIFLLLLDTCNRFRFHPTNYLTFYEILC